MFFARERAHAAFSSSRRDGNPAVPTSRDDVNLLLLRFKRTYYTMSIALAEKTLQDVAFLDAKLIPMLFDKN